MAKADLYPVPKPSVPELVPYWQRMEQLKQELREIYLRFWWISPKEYAIMELRYNENHDPANGRFTSGPGGAGGVSGNRQIPKMGSRQLQKSIQSWGRRITEHKEKLAHPERLYPEWDKMDSGHKERILRHWKSEIKALESQLEDGQNELKKRE